MQEKFLPISVFKEDKKTKIWGDQTVALVGGNCQCFETFRTELDQISDTRDQKIHVHLHVFERQDIAIL